MTISAHIVKQLGSFRLDAALESSGVLGILGPSGSGKTKLLQCIAGIERPDRGRIAVNDRVFFDKDRRIDMAVQERRVGYLFQHYALFPHMTVSENIVCGIRIAMTRREKRAAAAAVMARLGLSGLEKHKPRQLSGGQQQRTALARILVGCPDILLLDEPFSALDAALKEEVMAQLSAVLSQFPKDVIMVTHSYDEAYRLCDAVAVLCGGSVVVCGPAEEVFAQPLSQTAASLMGCANIVPACRRGRRRVYVPSWHRELTVAADVGEGLRAVGIREHAFRPDVDENRADVAVSAVEELPFGRRIYFRYAGQDIHSPAVMRRADKDADAAASVGVRPADILLLYYP